MHSLSVFKISGQISFKIADSLKQFTPTIIAKQYGNMFKVKTVICDNDIKASPWHVLYL